MLPCALACGDGRRDAVPPRVVRDMVGDTIVVRVTTASLPRLRLVEELRIGGEAAEPEPLADPTIVLPTSDGGAVVWDALLRELRRYDRDGKLRRHIGRVGAGPGEFRHVNGLALLPGDEIALWDPGNQRVVRYDAGGEPVSYWRWESALIMQPHVLTMDGDGNLLLPGLAPGNGAAGSSSASLVYVRVSREGRARDTLRPPPSADPPLLTASHGGSSTAQLMPFHPQDLWIVEAHGGTVRAQGSDYTVHVARPGERPIRLHRPIPPVALGRGEADAARERVTRALRRVDPAWRWRGPELPTHKPIIADLVPTADGRLLVRRHVAAVTLAGTGADAASAEWAEPQVYDVYGRDLMPVGELSLPPGARLHWFSGQQLWGVERDALDVASIVRYRVEHP